MNAKLEALTKAVHDTQFATKSLREAHSAAGCVAQIVLLDLIDQQVKIAQRMKHLLECVELDEPVKEGGS